MPRKMQLGSSELPATVAGFNEAAAIAAAEDADMTNGAPRSDRRFNEAAAN